ncbi:MAG: hypothetical protein ACKOXT_02290 [Actinomycetota bacterium]
MAKEKQFAKGKEQVGSKKFLGIELTLTPKSKSPKLLIEVGGPPKANFLPKRIKDANAAEFVRRRLFAASLATVSISFLAFLASAVISFSGDLILANAELRLSSVKAEQAKYANIRDLETAVIFRHAARATATAPEIDVRQLIRSLTSVLPEGAKYVSLQLSPFAEQDLKTSGLTNEFSVKVSIAMQLSDFPSLQQYLNSLPTLAAFYDFKLASVSSTETGINASLTVYFTTELFSRPYSADVVLGDPVPLSILDTPTPSPRPTTSSTSSSSSSSVKSSTPTPTSSPQVSSPTPTPSPSEEAVAQ